MIHRLLTFFIALSLGLSSFTQGNAAESEENPFDFSAFYEAHEKKEPIQAELFAEQSSIQPGQPFWLATKVIVHEGWHTYWKHPGDAGIACSIEWVLPEGFHADECQWPTPNRYTEGEITYFGYKSDFVLMTKITPPKNTAVTATPVALGATLRWLACNKEACLPGESNMNIALPVRATPPEPNVNNKRLFSEAHAEIAQAQALDDDLPKATTIEPEATSSPAFPLAWALLLAFLGGAILNLMPCVLPVISVKILQLVKMAGASRRAIIQHGLVFTLGVLVSFWLLAGILLSLQAYGRSVGWGFQLQEPIFVGSLAAVLLIFGLSLFGLFEFGTLFSSWAGQRESRTVREQKGLSAAFFGGVLATAVATPCTGPFLGSAVGLAVTLPTFGALAIFTAIGLGMSLPYMLLTAFPPLMKWLPRPGPWMIRFKELMGFLMLGTVLWLVWVFGAQTSTLGVMALLTGFFIATVACWIYGSWGTLVHSARTRFLSLLSTALLLILSGYFIVGAAAQTSFSSISATTETADLDNAWLPFSKKSLDTMRAEGKPVFIDFTAKWCLICQANHYVLELAQVREKFQEHGVVRFLADWTRSDPEITQELRKHGRSGVPLYVLYLPNVEEPIILPQLLTPEIVLNHLTKIQES
jgi:thiol:disulfide interchange protein